MDLRLEGLNEAVEDYTKLWFAVFVLERDELGLKLIRWYSNGYTKEKWLDKIYRQYQQIDEKGYRYYYLYEKTYEAGKITRKLFKLKSKDNFWEVYIRDDNSTVRWSSLSWMPNNYTEVPLDTIEETRWFQPETLTGLDFVSLFVVGNIDKISLLQKVESNVYSIDRKICMLDSQFLQNIESIILFKGLSANEAWFSEKKSDFRNRMIFTDDSDTDVQFIKNTNELIDKAMEYEQRQIKTISAMTNIPLRFFWVDENDGSSGRNARMLTQSAFIKMLDSIKIEFKTVFENILNKINKDTLVRFKDTVLKDSYDLAEELKIAREARIISQLEAIRRYQNLDKKHAELELKKIEEETENEEMQLWWDSPQEKDNWPKERKERND